MGDEYHGAVVRGSGDGCRKGGYNIPPKVEENDLPGAMRSTVYHDGFRECKSWLPWDCREFRPVVVPGVSLNGSAYGRKSRVALSVWGHGCV